MIAPTRRAILAGLGLTALGAGAGFPAVATDRLAPFRRGVSIHNVLNWGEAEADRTRYRWPPFATAQHRLRPGILDAVKMAGFDFIRLTIDPGVFLSFDGARRDDLDRQMMGEVQKLAGMGFGVIVDFHPTSQIAAIVPISDTGTASNGMIEARQVCRNRMTTSTTSTSASNRVCTTASMEPRTKMVGS